jgi:hypothetical protein
LCIFAHVILAVPALPFPAAEPGAIQLNIQMASKLFETYVRESA